MDCQRKVLHGGASPKMFALHGGASPKESSVRIHSPPASVDKLGLPSVAGGSGWCGVVGPMDRVETAEWQQVERFLDMLVSATKTGRNPEQLAAAFARHLTVIRQREELRIQALRQLEQQEGESSQLDQLQQELNECQDKIISLTDDKATLENELTQMSSELVRSETALEESTKHVQRVEAELAAVRADAEKAAQSRDGTVDELRELLRHKEQEQLAANRLAGSKRERDAAQLELYEAELSLMRNKVKDVEEQLELTRSELKVSEDGRKEALGAAAAAHDDFAKARRDYEEAIEKHTRSEKERKVYETAARKAAGELVSLRLQNDPEKRALSPPASNRSQSPPALLRSPSRDLLNVTLTSEVSTNALECIKETLNDTIHSLPSSKGSEKATTASDVECNLVAGLNRTSTPNSMESDKSTASKSDPPSPDNTMSASEPVMRAALELAAQARAKAERALQMREEEQRAREQIAESLQAPEQHADLAQPTPTRALQGAPAGLSSMAGQRHASPPPPPRVAASANFGEDAAVHRQISTPSLSTVSRSPPQQSLRQSPAVRPMTRGQPYGPPQAQGLRRC